MVAQNVLYITPHLNKELIGFNNTLSGQKKALRQTSVCTSRSILNVNPLLYRQLCK